MSGVNKAIILGHLGKDPEIRYTTSGSAVANISIATSEQWKDKQTGEKQERTEWHNVTFFGRLAEVVGEYLKKGSLVYVSGRIQTDKYTDKEGVEKYSTKIIANEMQMLGGRGVATSAQGADGGQPSTQAATNNPASAQGGEFDGHIPF